MYEALAKATGELWLYHSFANRIFEGQLPYRDFFPEYPPLALLILSLPNVLGERYYTLIYYGLVGLCIALICLMLKGMKGNYYAFMAAIMPLAGLLWDRFDIFPALFVVLALYLSEKNKIKTSAIALSLGVLTKIYPIVLLPLVIKRPYCKSFLAFSLPIVLTIEAIIAYGGKEGLTKFVKFQGDRGIQIESVRAMPLLWKGLKDKDSVVVEYLHNTYEIRPR